MAKAGCVYLNKNLVCAGFKYLDFIQNNIFNIISNYSLTKYGHLNEIYPLEKY